jgi:uncharacterized membrane protein
VVAAVGAALLAGAAFHRWFWLGLQAGVTFGFVFVHWLIFQSLYRIGALCPYRMIVWAVTISIFWYVTLRNLPARLAVRYHGVVLTLWADAHRCTVLAVLAHVCMRTVPAVA